MSKYTVTNVYGIRGETHHRTPEAARFFPYRINHEDGRVRRPASARAMDGSWSIRTATSGAATATTQ